MVVVSGVDDNGNRVLEPAEVDATQHVCAGANGLTALAFVSAEPAGANCPTGGAKVSVGVDRNRDSMLDATEVTSFEYVCGGVPAVPGQSVTMALEPAGANCPSGGVRLRVRAGDVAYVCNGRDAISPWLTGDGVDIEVTRLALAAGAAIVEFTLDDTPGAGGRALDRDGLLTQGAVEVSFVLAQLSPVDGAWVPYTTRVLGASTQAAAEAVPENFETLDAQAGRYRYTFAAPLAGFQPALTQTVIAVATRTVAGAPRHARAQAWVRPDGGAPFRPGAVADAGCASCHGELAGHGGRYAAVEQCIVCHGRQASDLDGSSVDFRVMIHKIHRGADLPSVGWGRPYQLRDGGGTLHDYSTVRYPQSIERCGGCHVGLQGQSWQDTADLATCTSCHDDLVFAAPVLPGEVQHADGVPASTPCVGCHASGSAGPTTVASHSDPSFDLSVTLALEIEPMGTIPPGASPSFTFTVKVDGAPRNILTSPLSSLRATVAGPNSDFTTYWTTGTTSNPFVQATIQGSGAIGALAAVDAAAGRFRYTFPPSITVPADATGSFTLGLEGSINAALPRFAATSPTRAFAVTDPVAVPRRSIIDPGRCNGCHHDLTFHGGGRRGAAYCVMCHGPENANNDRVARFEGSTVLAESVDFGVMIHKIHMGDALQQPYFLGGNPTPSTTNPAGTMTDFGNVRYPRSPAECAACHLPGTWALPGADDRAPRILQELACIEDPAYDTDSYCTTPFWRVVQTVRIAPQTAACTSCHDATYTAAHAQVNTTSLGAEACATCHGPGKSSDVARVHAR